MQLYLIRHTSPDIEKGICYGQADIPLNERLFKEELDSIRSKIPVLPQVFYSSPLKRCWRLAEEFSPLAVQDPRLKELNFGDWELKSWKAIPTAALQVWMDDFVNQAVPRGENYLTLFNRTDSFLKDLLLQPLESAGLVTHAGNIRSIISWALGLPLENSFRITIPYGTVVDLEISGNKQLNKLNFIK